MSNSVHVEGLSKRYESIDGNPIEALRDVGLEIEAGSFVSVLGPSGCGKSTLLRILAGLESYSDGTVSIAGQPVKAPRSDASMVFQQPVLLPWRTVLDNVMLPVEVMKLDSTEYRNRALALLELVGLDGFYNAYPKELSGGMRQRVALVRALIHEPALMLMDEPFGALDAMTRESMNLELLRIWGDTDATVLFVTHSIIEAVFLSDSVVVLSGRPGAVLETVGVDLPRPRTFDTMYSETFGALTSRIRELLSAQAMVE